MKRKTDTESWGWVDWLSGGETAIHWNLSMLCGIEQRAGSIVKSGIAESALLRMSKEAGVEVI